MPNQPINEAAPRKPATHVQDPDYHYVSIEKMGGNLEEFGGQYESLVNDVGAELVKGEERKRRQLYRYPKEVYEARQKAIEDEAEKRVRRKEPIAPGVTDEVRMGAPMSPAQVKQLSDQLKELQAQEAAATPPNT